jgi:hypothetical protein
MKKLALLSLLLLVHGPLSNNASAGPSGSDFEITKSTIDGGGGTSEGGGFTLTGTIGQHDASATTSSGGGFLLAGGFWARASDVLLSDGFED